MLKARGYGTDSIETLDLWSQTPDYHICQIVAFKTVPERIRQQAFYKIYSPIYALFFAFVATLWASNFSVGKKVYKKLRMGVRDGSLSMLEYPDHIVFLGHLHHWDKQTESFVASFTSETEKSIIIMGDINLDNSQKLLRRSFFRTDTLAWQDLFGHMGRTFGFEGLYYPLWMRWLMYTSPDMAVGR